MLQLTISTVQTAKKDENRNLCKNFIRKQYINWFLYTLIQGLKKKKPRKE